MSFLKIVSAELFLGQEGGRKMGGMEKFPFNFLSFYLLKEPRNKMSEPLGSSLFCDYFSF